jgi:imidazolonepropionase-like amidohydrolase
MADRRLVTADRVWPGEGPGVIDHGFVLSEAGVITAVGRTADLGSAADGAERTDLAGCTLMPGLINTHVHLVFSASMTPVADFLTDREAGVDAMVAAATARLEASTRVGVTTVRDLGGPNEVVFAIRDGVAADRIAGGRVVASGSPITSPGGHCHWFSHECGTSDEIIAAVRTQSSLGADLIKIFATGGNLTPDTDPFAPQYAEDELAACVREAHALGLPVAAHAHAPEGIRRAAAAGVSTIEHCFFETPDGVEYDPRAADLMVANGVAFCPTFGASLLRLMELPREQLAPVPARLLAKFEQLSGALRALRAAGATLVAGSDAGIPMRHHTDYPADVAAMARPDTLGLRAREALEAATSVAARQLGLTDCGLLEPGRRADVLAVEGDPLTDVQDLTRTRLVWAGGRSIG